MPKTIALVSCVKEKHTTPMPAGELYTSSLFRKASAYARQTADQWYILSAKHGLLSPSDIIAPYDETLNRMGVAQRRAWADRVVRSLKKVLRRRDRVVLLAGQRYREYLVDPIRKMGCTVEIPIEGLTLGRQLSWLKERVG